jgi:hypothetical protein
VLTVLIGSDICIRTTTHLRFHPINKAAVIVTHNFTMLWHAPPEWVNKKAYMCSNPAHGEMYSIHDVVKFLSDLQC